MTFVRIEPSHRFALVLMARVPRVGRCKTRLCPPLSAEEATLLYRAFLTDITREVREWDLPVDLWLAWWDGEVEGEGEALPPLLQEVVGEGYHSLRQQGPTLTARMEQVFRELLGRGYRWVIQRNTDSPHLPRALVEQAMDALELRPGRVVLGPDLDGGYYLIGTGDAPDGLMPSQMSTPTVLEETMERVRARQLEPVLLETFPDIDTPLDLATFWLEFGSRADIRRWATWRLLSESDILSRLEDEAEEAP